MGVKDNQPTLRQRVQVVSATTAPLGSAHSHDKGRNRDGRRTAAVFDPNGMLAGTGWHPHAAAIIRVEDRPRIRTNPGVFARPRSFAFLLKANRTDTPSQDRYRAGLAGVKELLKVLAVSQR